jgi:hypothetical protein
VEYFTFDVVHGGYDITVFTGLDDMSSGAVFVMCPQAQMLTRNQICAVLINVGVEKEELIAMDGLTDIGDEHQLHTHVGTFWAADILSQKSPG